MLHASGCNARIFLTKDMDVHIILIHFATLCYTEHLKSIVPFRIDNILYKYSHGDSYNSQVLETVYIIILQCTECVQFI